MKSFSSGRANCRARRSTYVHWAIWCGLASFTLSVDAADDSVRETLIAELNTQCRTDLNGFQRDDPRHDLGLMRIPAKSIPALCKCAEAGIRKDAGFDHVASMPSFDRAPDSKPMFYVRQSYILYGLMCVVPSAPKGSGYAIQPPDRSMQDVLVVLRAHTTDFYGSYKLALKRRPGLAGKVVLGISIEPSGAVSDVAIRSSTLHVEQFEQDLTSAIGAMNFGQKNVRTVVLTYPIEFIPQ